MPTINAQFLIFSGMVCLTVLISIPLVFFLMNKFKIGIERTNEGNIKVGPTSKEEKKKNLNNIYCYNSKCNLEKISSIFYKRDEIYKSIDELKNSILGEQMRIAETKIEVIKETDMSYFLDFMCEKLTGLTKDNIRQDDNYLSYVNLTYILYDITVIKILRNSFKENHLNDKRESEWHEFKTEKINYILKKMNKILDIHYLRNGIVSRTEIDSYMEIHFVSQLKEVINEVFDDTRKISKEINDKIIQKRIQLDELLDEITGLNS